MKVAETFAKFVKHTKIGDVDVSVIEHVKKMTLKQVMGVLVGAKAPTSRKIIRYVKQYPGRPEAGVYGCGFKADVAQAAYINGFFGHASEMEDDQFPGGGISDVTTWPALLTAADHLHLSGQETIVSLYVGQEMQNRIAMYASVGTDGIGICNLPFIGIYGATACCARAFELTEEQVKASFGLAMVTGLGYMHTWGTDAHFHESATVCKNAVINAMLAKDGASSNPVIEKCLDMLTGGDKNLEFDKMLEGLGQAPFYSNNTWLKKWGFCFFTHNFVDVLDKIVKENKIKPGDIDEIILHFDPLREVVDRPEPHDAEDSRFSTQHVLAFYLAYGECNLLTCTETALADQKVAKFRKKIKVEYHPEYEKRYFGGEGKMDVRLKNGKTFSDAMDQPLGSPKYPLSMDQVVDIYRKYCKGILSDSQIKRTTDLILNMENEPDLQELYDICTFRHMV
ncbi:MAG: MmgE/PrpD family protein [Proteobacteria bacterium]|nr:MmgE/PrpD family protein [Pseudomonadota bacterium]